MNSYNATVILDSISPAGVRLTTIELRFPRFVLAQLNRHRAFSNNSASSRAIPIWKMLLQVLQNPVEPLKWNRNQRGMQAGEELPGWKAFACKLLWHAARLFVTACVWSMMQLDLAKETANRLIEPWMWSTVLITGNADAWANFFFLRLSHDAQPEIQCMAGLAFDAFRTSSPKLLQVGEWHTPLILPDEQDLPINVRLHVSAGRCARLSYLTHHGVRDIGADVGLFDRLVSGSDGAGHWTPTEHQATPLADPDERSGNFVGWRQYRQDFGARQYHSWADFTESDVYREIVA